MKIDSNKVVEKVHRLVEERSIPKKKLGEVLGSKGKDHAKITRANNFLQGKSSITLDTVNALAKFFDKTINYFLGIEEENILRSSDKFVKIEPPLSSQQIAENLRRAGNNEEFIQNILAQIEYERKRRNK